MTVLMTGGVCPPQTGWEGFPLCLHCSIPSCSDEFPGSPGPVGGMSSTCWRRQVRGLSPGKVAVSGLKGYLSPDKGAVST